jgi:hypothetical protein
MSGLSCCHLQRRRREVRGREGNEEAVDGVTETLEGVRRVGDVGLTEGEVLTEHEDRLAGAECLHVGLGGLHVLVRLATGAEGVAVHAGDGVVRGRAGDVQDLVLRRERRQLIGDARVTRATDDLVAGAHVGLEVRDGGRRVVRVVVPVDVELLAVHPVGAVRRVPESDVEALAPLGLVRRVDTGLLQDHAHFDGGLRLRGRRA